MIIYDLECDQGHTFEGWFPNVESFELQNKDGLIACAVCGSYQVSKKPTAAHIAASGISKKEKPQPAPQNVNVDPVVLMKSIHKFVAENFKNVGDSFADEAIKMHRGESKPELISGNITPNQKRVLDDEGVPVAVIPKLSEEFEN